MNITPSPLKHYKTLQEYYDFSERLKKVTNLQEKTQFNRLLCRTDLFWLLWFGCQKHYIAKQWLLDRCKEVEAKPNDCLDLWAREHMKMLPLKELVPTPHGWKFHGDLKKGDEVFGSNGKPVKVVAKTEVFTNGECFEIEFNSGLKIRAGAKHLWPIELRSRKRVSGTNKRVYRENFFMTTRDIFEQGHSPDGRMSLKCDTVLDLPIINLPIKPYTLGAWLGDGNSASARITCAYKDNEIIDNIINDGYSISEGRSSNKNTGLYCIGKGIRGKRNTGLTSVLRKLKLKNNKHIPIEYLRSSFEQRLSLLQGLMDTDGTCNDRGTATFTNINPALIDSVFELASSLGLNPKQNEQQIKVNNQDYIFYQVSFQAYKDKPVFKLQRKLNKCKEGSRKNNRRFIVGCKRIESEPMSCIQVAHEDGIYLVTKAMIPTHNSTIVTYGKSIQDILASHGEDPLKEWDREVSIGIFSVTRPIAKQFLREIKLTFESSPILKTLFPDVLYQNPTKESPKWSEDEGIVVRRKSIQKEATIEAWGLVDGMPTSKHFLVRNYDDIVTDKSVTTPDMIIKTTDALRLSSNLGCEGGLARYVGTIYHANDSYSILRQNPYITTRIYPCTAEGTWPGTPVLKGYEFLAQKYAEQGPYIFSCQMLLNPVADSLQNFKEEWLKYYGGWAKHYTGNIYIIVDPANSKEKTSDYTVMLVVAACDDQNYYIVDMIRDRLNLKERTETLFSLVKQYKNKGFIHVGYEQYGMQADIDHIREKQDELNYHFLIKELGGKLKKIIRIGKLVPDFEQHRIYIPRQILKKNYEGKVQNLVDIFVKEEYLSFPTPQHDDMLDALARIKDDTLALAFPLPLDVYQDESDFDRLNNNTRNLTTGY